MKKKAKVCMDVSPTLDTFLPRPLGPAKMYMGWGGRPNQPQPPFYTLLMYMTEG